MIRTVIIDDEEDARSTLRAFLKHTVRRQKWLEKRMAFKKVIGKSWAKTQI